MKGECVVGLDAVMQSRERVVVVGGREDRRLAVSQRSGAGAACGARDGAEGYQMRRRRHVDDDICGIAVAVVAAGR